MIKASLVLLVGLLASAALTRRPAAVRHWVIVCAIACAALLPALEMALPVWDPPFPLPWSAKAMTPTVMSFGIDGTSEQDASPVSVPPRASPLPLGLDRSPLRAVWLVGAVAGLITLLVGWRRLGRVLSTATVVVDGPWMDALAALEDASNGRRVRLLQSDAPSLLFTWGLSRPAILLPAGAQAWPAPRITAVLAHELAHVHRRDWFIQMLAELFRIVYWFNPLAWLACIGLRQASEQACDDAVIDGGLAPQDYAAHLLEIAREFQRSTRHPLLPVMTMIRRSSLERRIRAMLSATSHRSTVSRVAGFVTAAVLLCLTLPLAGMSLEPQSPPPIAVVVHKNVMVVTPAPTVSSPDTTPVAPSTARPDTPVPQPSEPSSPQNAAPAAVRGVISDAMHRAMPRVTVSIARTDGTGAKPQMRTGDDGRFEISGLPAGEYTVSASQPGFKTYKLVASLQGGATKVLDILMSIGSLQETVVITAPPAGSAPEQPSLRVLKDGAVQTGPDPCDNSPVGGCLTIPRKIFDMKPVYPADQAAGGASGVVTIKGTIDVNGTLKDLVADPASAMAFAPAAMDAVRQWKFSPVKLNGIPQECQITVVANFAPRKE